MREFKFEAKSGRHYIPIAIVATILSVFTAGIARPWAIVMIQKWKADHTLVKVNGKWKRLRFYGSGSALFGKWILWWFYCFITAGIYTLVLYPRMQKWIAENTGFSDPDTHAEQEEYIRDEELI